MSRPDLPYLLWDLAKVVGGVVKDTLDVGEYRITILIEKKINNKIGIVMETITVDKKMSALDAEIITRKLKELVEKK